MQIQIRGKLLISIFTLLVLIFGCSSKGSTLDKWDIKPLVDAFLRAHVKYSEFDDAISEKTLNNIINQLDPAKYYFHKEDIQRFQSYKHEIDNYVNNGDYAFLNDIFNVYRRRHRESIDIFNRLIGRNIDFKQDETIDLDREKAEYTQNTKDLEERWRKKIKFEIINYLAIEKNLDRAKEKLKKRYKLLNRRIDEIDNKQMYSMFLNSFSMALDPHSNYLTKEDHEDFMIQTNLKLEGIGVMLRSEDGYVLVEHIIPGGAADKLAPQMQLKPNDRIIGVAQNSKESVDVTDMDLRDVVKLIRGNKGTEVRLTVLRKAEGKQEFSRLIVPIVREVVKLEEQAAKSEIISLPGDASRTRVGYLKLPSFYLDFDAAQSYDPDTRSSFRDVKTQITEMKKKGMDALILDLRGNPGGALDEAINIAGLFIDQGPILQIKGTDRWGSRNTINVLRDNYPGVIYDGPIVVLVDKFSASASEILAGAIRDYGRGLILGPTSTFGKGTVQSYAKLMDGLKGAMKVTTGIFYQPAGKSNHLVGIPPHIIVPDMSAIWDIGEDKLRYPLQWEPIPSTQFTPYRKYINDAIVSSLAAQSKHRIAANPKYASMIAKIDKLKKELASKAVSLREEERAKQEDMKNVEKYIQNKDRKTVDLQNDLFLSEAVSITIDYVRALRR